MISHSQRSTLGVIPSAARSECDGTLRNLLSQAPVLSVVLSVEGLGVKGDVSFAGGFFLRVFLHPCFPASAGGCVATGESQCWDISVKDRHFFIVVLGKKTDDRIS